MEEKFNNTHLLEYITQASPEELAKISDQINQLAEGVTKRVITLLEG